MSNFKTNDLVLARRNRRNNCIMPELWLCYTFIGEDDKRYYFTDGIPHDKDNWEIISFKGNENLLGKTDNISKSYLPEKNELVAMRHTLNDEWTPVIFVGMTDDNTYRGRILPGYYDSFKYCEPIKKHFTYEL